MKNVSYDYLVVLTNRAGEYLEVDNYATLQGALNRQAHHLKSKRKTDKVELREYTTTWEVI